MTVSNKEYSKTSLCEHLYIVNTSFYWTLWKTTERFLQEINLSLVNTSVLWTVNTFFVQISIDNLFNVNIFPFCRQSNT
jgi:hypothetical protein